MSDQPAPPPAPARDPAAERAKNVNLAWRVGTAAVLVPIVLPIIWWGGWPMAAVVGLAAALCALEFGAMAMGADRLRWPAAAAAFAMPFFYVVPGLGEAKLHWLWAGLALVVLTWRLLRDAPVTDAGPRPAFAVFAAVYGSLVGYLMPLRLLGPEKDWSGAGWVILVCAITWLGDTGAYFVGRFFGRHKFYPRISPAKTWEGFFGGMAFAVGSAFATAWLLLPALTPLDCALLGVIGGVAGPVGDLAESMLKRSFGVKDSGHILPGHGGMLDRVDALMFNAVAVYAYAALVVATRAG